MFLWKNKKYFSEDNPNLELCSPVVRGTIAIAVFTLSIGQTDQSKFVAPNKMLQSVMNDQGLHCLPVIQ